jgi:hypothetical protein
MRKIAALLLDSIEVPIEIEEYLEHGQAAHATYDRNSRITETTSLLFVVSLR